MWQKVGRLGMSSDLIRHGVLAINKPCGQSSAQVLRDCQLHFNPSSFFKPAIEASTRALLKETKGQFKKRRDVKRVSQVKIGHGGTLDPLATGVLIVGIGTGTKKLPQFLQCTKTYEAIVVFGVSTDTYDRVGRVITRRPYEHITKDMVLKELASFRGPQKQMPPLYSALKVNGKPLYEYAREGKAVPREIEARDVEAHEVELLEWYEPGTHNHRWPTEEAEAAECRLAEQVWRVKKLQETAERLTPEDRDEDRVAVAAHESFKRKFEERQDQLIVDRPKKQRRTGSEALMSGALAPPRPPGPPGHSTKGSNLVPAPVDESTPPPWEAPGPPACKVRLTITSGYYVRSFCHDLGTKLGSAGIMAELCRSRQGDFTIDGPNTLQLDDLAQGEEVWAPKVSGMLSRWNEKVKDDWQRPDKAEAAGSGANGESKPPPAKVEEKEKEKKEKKGNEEEEEWNGIPG